MSTSATRDPLVPAANLRLALLGLPTVASGPDNQAELVSPLLARQRELSRRQGDRLPPVVQAALALHDEDLANFAPGLALLSSRHETQYSRLFRS